jgi:hypothetical protein
MRRAPRGLLLLSGACALACVSAREFRQTTSTYPPTQKDNILVFTDPAAVGRPYETIATIYSEGSSGWDKKEHDLVDKMRGKAAKLGASAIIVREFNKSSTTAAKVSAALLGTNDLKLQCVAIRFIGTPPAATTATGGAAPAAASEVATTKPVTNDDVVKLVAGGLGDEVIITKIHRGPTAFALDADNMLQLRKAGVSEAVLRAMLESTK